MKKKGKRRGRREKKTIYIGEKREKKNAINKCGRMKGNNCY